MVRAAVLGHPNLAAHAIEDQTLQVGSLEDDAAPQVGIGHLHLQQLSQLRVALGAEDLDAQKAADEKKPSLLVAAVASFQGCNHHYM